MLVNRRRKSPCNLAFLSFPAHQWKLLSGWVRVRVCFHFSGTLYFHKLRFNEIAVCRPLNCHQRAMAIQLYGDQKWVNRETDRDELAIQEEPTVYGIKWDEFSKIGTSQSTSICGLKLFSLMISSLLYIKTKTLFFISEKRTDDFCFLLLTPPPPPIICTN